MADRAPPPPAPRFQDAVNPHDRLKIGLGWRIHVLRWERSPGSTQWLAAIFNKTTHAIRDWELGKSSPNVYQLTVLCDLFQVSADFLLTGDTRGLPEETQERLRRLGLIGAGKR